MKELTFYEMKEVNGGWLLSAILLLGAMVNDAINNPDDFKSGFDAVYQK